MVNLLLHGDSTGVAASLRISPRLHKNIASRVRAPNNTPDFRTIYGLRRDHLEALFRLFLQVLELCQRESLTKL